MDNKTVAICWIIILLTTNVFISCDNSSAYEKYLLQDLNIPKEIVIKEAINQSDTLCEVRYKSFQTFDFSMLKEGPQAVDTPYVFVNRTKDRIILRLSNDIDHPYVFTNHDSYWHCRWINKSLNDSIVVDRFIRYPEIYEYIQKRISKNNISVTLNIFDYEDPFASDNLIITQYFIDLGVDTAFDRTIESNFDKVLDKRKKFMSDLEHVDSLLRDSLFKWNLIRIDHHYSGILAKQYYTYFQRSRERNIQYSFSPVDIYDDNKDMNRPKNLRRIM